MSWPRSSLTAMRRSVPAAQLVFHFGILTDVDVRRVDMRQFVDGLSAERSPVEVEFDAADWLRLRQCLPHSRGEQAIVVE